jgi:hypothetical protein
MKRKVVNSRVGHDGVLHLDIPLDPTDADRDVIVTIVPRSGPPMSVDEWRAAVKRSAGSITDPEFKRHPQGEYEVREELP